MGQNVYVNGSCSAGFEPTNANLPPQRLCPASGTYTATLLNPCIRTRPSTGGAAVGRVRLLTSHQAVRARSARAAETNCSAATNFANANWSKTAAGLTAVGTCGTGYAAGAPLRLCQLNGVWASTVSNPCQRACPRA